MTDVSRPEEGLCACGERPEALCVCAHVEPIRTRTELLILQHPQERSELLGTASLTAKLFPETTFRVGLSWPSLSAALGRDADPKRWAVLHLGSAPTELFPPGETVVAVDAKGHPLDDPRALLGLEGVVLFDGSWSQAKTLWWRNAWVLKSRRIALNPPAPSLYGRLRKEPRREGLSTLEAAALTLARLERDASIERHALSLFRRMLQRYRDHALIAKPKPARQRPRPVQPPT